MLRMGARISREKVKITRGFGLVQLTKVVAVAIVINTAIVVANLVPVYCMVALMGIEIAAC